MAELWTHADVLEHLADLFFPGTPGGTQERLARMAVRNAYRDLPSRARWKYLNRRGQVITSAPYSTGTISFDFSGGASERLVTLSGGTFPSWAKYGFLVIDNIAYKVESRVSATTLTLDEVTNPGDDVAAGTAYSLYRSVYALPNGFRKIGAVVDVTTNEELLHVSAEEIVGLLSGQSTTGTPVSWAVRGLRADYVGQMAIEFHPPPSSAQTYDFLFANECRALVLKPEISDGTVTVAGGSTSVAGTNTVFPADCVGAVMRFSPTTTDKPTNLTGANPYTHQAIITARASATALTLDDAPDVTLTAVKYTISDPIDVEAGSMFTYFLKACEAELHRMLGKDKWQDAQARADAALRIAAAADYERVEMTNDSPRALSHWDNSRVSLALN